MTPTIVVINKNNFTDFVKFCILASIKSPIALLLVLGTIALLGSMLSPMGDVTKFFMTLIVGYLLLLVQPILSLAACFRLTMKKGLIECFKVFNSTNHIRRTFNIITLYGVPLVAIIAILSGWAGDRDPIAKSMEDSALFALGVGLILGYLNADVWISCLCKFAVTWSFPHLTPSESNYYIEQGKHLNTKPFTWMKIYITIMYGVGISTHNLVLFLTIVTSVHTCMIFAYYVYVSGQYPRTREKVTVLKPVESV